MPCNNNYNGRTFLNSILPLPGATAADTTYVVDLTHYTCGGRKICANGAYPVTGDLAFKAQGAPRAVGNDAYVQDILITGTCTYMPYKSGQGQCGCGCPACPVTENVWEVVSVPVASATTPTITAGETLAEPTNLRDCCSITNAVSLVCSFNLATA